MTNKILNTKMLVAGLVVVLVGGCGSQALAKPQRSNVSSWPSSKPSLSQIVTLTSPNGGQTFYNGNVVDVQWYCNTPGMPCVVPVKVGIYNRWGQLTILGQTSTIASHLQVTIPNDIISDNMWRFYVEASTSRYTSRDLSDGYVELRIGTPSITSISPASGPAGTQVTLQGNFDPFYSTLIWDGVYGGIGFTILYDGHTLYFNVPNDATPGVHTIQVGGQYGNPSTATKSNPVNFTVTQ